MFRILAAAFILLSLTAPEALAERLTAPQIRKAVPGKWSGTYKQSSIVLQINADGTVTGRYGSMPARGSWTTKRSSKGDEICLTFRAVILSDTKCGELFRRGNNILYGYLNRGKPRLWLRRS